MSKVDSTATETIAREAVDVSRALLEAAATEELQIELFETPSPEDIAEAREDLGPDAGGLSVVRHARDKRRAGRPAGVRNRRTEDFEKYIRQFGQDPAITMMQIQSTPPEMLIEASRKTVRKVVKDRVVTIHEELSYAEAQSLRIRCAEGLMPFVHSKKPVSIDARILGVRIVEEVSDGRTTLLDGDAVRVARPEDDLGDEP
jgi:hypothetical protein